MLRWNFPTLELLLWWKSQSLDDTIWSEILLVMFFTELNEWGWFPMCSWEVKHLNHIEHQRILMHKPRSVQVESISLWEIKVFKKVANSILCWAPPTDVSKWCAPGAQSCYISCLYAAEVLRLWVRSEATLCIVVVGETFHPIWCFLWISEYGLCTCVPAHITW